jgi:rod shape-determining protein MreD
MEPQQTERMSLFVAAIGAVLASLLETSVLTELNVGLDLVLVLAITSGLLIGADAGLAWAFIGGLSLDVLAPGDHALGATVLSLLLVTGSAFAIGRLIEPPRLAAVVFVVFALTFAFHALFAVVLAATSGVSLSGFSLASTALSAVLNAVLALVAGRLIRVVADRLEPAERTLR